MHDPSTPHPASGEGVLLRNTTRDSVVASHAVVARSFVARLLGLLFRPPLASGEGLLIDPCSSVHTLGMRYPIDVLFVDRDGHVVGLNHALAPGRLYAGARGARLTIELPAGAIAASGTQLGDTLRIDPAATSAWVSAPRL